MFSLNRGTFVSDRSVAVILALLAIALYLPGITWGLPEGTPGRSEGWAPDEIAPMGPLMAAHAVLSGGDFPTKYPLLHYALVAAAYAPYIGAQLLTGSLDRPTPGYPYGFHDPVASLRALTLIARALSLLMAAGTVVVAFFTAKALWDRTAGVLAAACVLLLYPLFFYGKIANVDGPALFWTALALAIVPSVFAEGWTRRNAIWMGIFAGLAMATKDQSFAVLFPVAIALLPFHARAQQRRESQRSGRLVQPPLAGLAAAVAVYLSTSGALLRPDRFQSHLDYIRRAVVNDMPSLWYYRYGDDLAGYAGLMREFFSSAVDSLGWPLFAVACAGVLLAARRRLPALILLLPVPVLLFAVILPVRHTAIRFVLPLAYILALFAGFALAAAFRARVAAVRQMAYAVLILGAGYELARAADLTRLMWNDPRYQAAAWLQQNTRPGDRVGFYESASGRLRGRINRMPWFPSQLEIEDASRTLATSLQPGQEVVITVGPEDQELHWFIPAAAQHALRSGSVGFEQVATFQRRWWFRHPHLDHHINPRVEIFLRRERAAEVRAVHGEQR